MHMNGFMFIRVKQHDNAQVFVKFRHLSSILPTVRLSCKVLHVLERGPAVLDERNKKATSAKYGMVPRTQDPILPSKKIIQLEGVFIPQELQRDYDKTFGHNPH